jgi:hypothetical protein
MKLEAANPKTTSCFNTPANESMANGLYNLGRLYKFSIAERRFFSHQTKHGNTMTNNTSKKKLKQDLPSLQSPIPPGVQANLNILLNNSPGEESKSQYTTSTSRGYRAQAVRRDKH